MESLKLMTVSHSHHLPKIMFSGLELEHFGFHTDMLSTVAFENGCLTINACGTGLDTYHQIISGVRKNKQQIVQVMTWTIAKKTKDYLTLTGRWLEKYGFATGDLIVVSFDYRCIKIKKITLENMIYHMKHRVLLVYHAKSGGHMIPQLFMEGNWLNETGIKATDTLSITYEQNQLTFELDKQIGGKRTKQQPSQIKVSGKDGKPCVCLGGRWLESFGFYIGDTLIVQYRKHWVRLTRIDVKQLTF